jgi:hypothetical protein
VEDLKRDQAPEETQHPLPRLNYTEREKKLAKKKKKKKKKKLAKT